MSGCQLETEKPLEALRQLPLLRKLKVGVDISDKRAAHRWLGTPSVRRRTAWCGPGILDLSWIYHDFIMNFHDLS